VPNTIVIFGASGDLTSRKLVPALYRLYRKKRLPANTRIVGFSRSPFTHDEFRNKLAETTAQFTRDDFDTALWNEFAQHIYYHVGDMDRSDSFVSLADFLQKMEGDESANRIYYLATAPQFYEQAVAQLGAAGLADETHGTRRVVIEKPFGVDLNTAHELNAVVHGVFSERQVYRIDHYLGKETVQNLLVFRFANSIFEPLWNRNYIDHVQITAAEEVAVGRRAGYYETAGVLRDMFQNHLMQIMTVAAMEAPVRFEANLVRNEKVKVLQAIRPFACDDAAPATFRAQYRGYREEPGVAEGSETATFAAIRLHIDNWRWHGVPFYLRSGKAMDCHTTQIVIQFHETPHMLFPGARNTLGDANRLVIHIQPAEGIQLLFQTKVPDEGMKLRLTDLDFRFDTEFAKALPDAYERLLLDVLAGDASLFARSDEVELAWGIIDPIRQCWENNGKPPLAFYDRGMWGPPECQEWMARDGREWLDVCPVLK